MGLIDFFKEKWGKKLKKKKKDELDGSDHPVEEEVTKEKPVKE